MKSILIAALMSFFILNPGRCQDENPNPDADGSRDHPMFNRMAGTFIVEYHDYDFESYDFPVSANQDGEMKLQTVEGHKTVIQYSVKEGGKASGWLAIRRNYENAAKKIGGHIVLLEPGNLGVTLMVPTGKSETWVEVVNNAGTADGMYTLNIVHREEMRQEITANSLLDSLNAVGHIALYINFETGKATLQEDAKPIIAQIVELMKSNADLAIIVEGHTDNVGKPADNKKLSGARANAVVAALAAEGVDKKRLTATGYGAEKPIADNSTEDGRAKNRRVELVKK